MRHQKRAGRRAVLALIQRVPAAEVAAALAVSPTAVSRWASGANAPSKRCQLDLEQLFGVSADLWRMPASGHRLQTKLVCRLQRSDDDDG